MTGEASAQNLPSFGGAGGGFWGDWQSWGEQTDGTYRNPVVPADYSDLDCIRVGIDYYAISSTMQFSPGMTILHSRDLVNWEIAGNAVSDLSQISEAMTWRQMDRYGRGLETSGPPVVWKSKDFVHWSFEDTYFPSASEEKYWAPSKVVQGKNGRWYIYPTVNGYMHVGVADSPDGPFRLVQGEDKFAMPYAEAVTLLKDGDRGGIDAEVFMDDDGQAYVFWGRRFVAKLADDMMTVSDIRQIETRRKEYSEGPIFSSARASTTISTPSAATKTTNTITR